jgi:hypothetical protein
VVEQACLPVQLSGLRKLPGARAVATIPGLGYPFAMARVLALALAREGRNGIMGTVAGTGGQRAAFHGVRHDFRHSTEAGSACIPWNAAILLHLSRQHGRTQMTRTREGLSGPRARALRSIIVLALAAIALGGCGSSNSGCLLAPCPGDFPAEPVTPTVDRIRVTTQVGGAALFSVHIEGITSPSIQWMRAAANGSYSTIAGATGSTYTLNGATTLDDGARFQATVVGGFNGNQVTLTSTTAQLAVVPLPAIVFEDTTFAPGDWTVSETSAPTTAGPTHAEQQVSTGGNPGSYRSTTITLPAGVNTLTEYDDYVGATYDPASQGAIYLVDFTQDCLGLTGSLGAGPAILLTQNGRHYTAGGPTLCSASTWSSKSLIDKTFAATDFSLIDGRACGVGESCPDFAADGLPIRFGFTNTNSGTPGFAGGSGGFGIDNWKVTVWRR